MFYLGRGVLLCAGSVVNHNAAIGDGWYLDVRCVVPQNCTVPETTKVEAVLCEDMFQENRNHTISML
jgi:UDP-3-O-[3-hydroxymyristoyl] glucosamine N-acyltransferase